MKQCNRHLYILSRKNIHLTIIYYYDKQLYIILVILRGFNINATGNRKSNNMINKISILRFPISNSLQEQNKIIIS